MSKYRHKFVCKVCKGFSCRFVKTDDNLYLESEREDVIFNLDRMCFALTCRMPKWKYEGFTELK